MRTLLHNYWSGYSPRLRVMVLYYAAAGLVFWYAAEKIFLTQVLHLSPAELILLINVTYVAHFFLDVPSSVLADRWSRNKTLALSLVSAWLAALVGGLAQGFWTYLWVAIFWAGASALHGGVADALVYDISSDEGTLDSYPATSNRMNNTFLAAISIALTLGGVIARYGGLRAPYFATLLVFLPVAWTVWHLPEPSFHREDQHESSKGHILESLRSLKKSPQLLFVALLTIINNGLIAIALYEFSQLVLSQSGLSLVGVGIATAITNTLLILVFTGVTTRLQSRAGWLLGPWYILAALGLLATRYTHFWPLLIVVYGTGITAQQMTSRWLAIALQQNVPSSERAATNSIVGTGSNLSWLAASPLMALALARWGAVGPSQVSMLFAVLAAIISLLVLAYFGKRFRALFATPPASAQ